MKYRKWIFIFFGLMVVLPPTLFVTFILTSAGVTGTLQVNTYGSNFKEPIDELTVLSINLAHGRANGSHQFLLSHKNIQDNLSKISRLISKEHVDIVSLQEADSPSWWSGGFSHVEFLANNSLFPFSAIGTHVDGLGLKYGTSILSRVPIGSAEQITFEGTFPTPTKGFVITSHWWQDLFFDVYSIHLDFASPVAKKEQLERISFEVISRKRPVILMGDFNMDAKSEFLQAFLKDLQLSTYQYENEELVTFPRLGIRIDWIFVSSEFLIKEHNILADTVSDHLAVKAKIIRQR